MNKLLLGEATLSIKERSYKEITRQRTISASEKVNHDLYEALREVRWELAQAEQVPAYIIFSNKSLEDMASRLPKNDEEFLMVEGVGSVKADKYAGQFLPVIQEFLSTNKNITTKEPEPLHRNTTQMASYLESAEYAEEGLTPYEIAIERGISESTVLNHLTQAAEEGELEEFDADVAGSKKQL